MRYITTRVAREIPGARLGIVPDADHLINLSQPKAFDEVLRDVLA
jgi:pimeloyl-ACP methyl ester carboxylesterase